MDNLCHSLLGAALAEAGLRRSSRGAYATLVIGANLPDVDAVASLAGSPTMLEVRRGVTHGLPAMVVLPLALTALVVLWHRRRPGPDDVQPLRPRRLLALAALSVWSHPLLDLLNSYGVRLLMPLSERWFHGDTLFIVDLVLWSTLGTGVALSHRAWSRSSPAAGRASRVALGLAAVYVAFALFVTRATYAAAAERFGAAAPVVVNPIPGAVLAREVIQDEGPRYVFWSARLRGWRVALHPTGALAKSAEDPRARAAAASDTGRRFFRWTRLPYFVCPPGGRGGVVKIGDVRYTRDEEASWASVLVTVP